MWHLCVKWVVMGENDGIHTPFVHNGNAKVACMIHSVSKYSHDNINSVIWPKLSKQRTPYDIYNVYTFI